MSLEAKIDALTSAVQELTRVIVSQHAPAGSINWMQQNAQVYQDAQRKGALTAAQAADVAKYEKQVEVPNDPPKSNTTTDTSPTSSPTSSPESAPANSVTYDDVKGVTIAVSKIDKAKAVAALQRFGVATAKALKEEQWADYVAYMTRVAIGEVDPEASHE